MHVFSSVHELNFMHDVDPQKLPGHMVFDFLAGELYSHLNYHLLSNTAVPADKLKSVSRRVVDVDSLPMSK